MHMTMPVCQTCYTAWTWKQACKKSFVLDTAMTCPHCGTKQYVSTRTRKFSAIMTLSIPLVFLVILLLDLSLSIALIILPILLALFIGLYPLFIELSNEEKPPGRP